MGYRRKLFKLFIWNQVRENFLLECHSKNSNRCNMSHVVVVLSNYKEDIYSFKTSLILSPSCITFLSSSSLSSWSSSQSSPFPIQKLWTTAQAIALLTVKLILLSNRFPEMLHRLFKIPKAHSTETLAAVSSLLKAISSRSLVASGKGFCSHGPRGYALSPTRQGRISWRPTRAVGLFRTSSRSARLYNVLFPRTRALWRLKLKLNFI